jgi:hypothetical protein
MKKGATRCVWLVGKYAIKTPRLCTWRNFLNGLLANMTEREFDCLAPELHAKVYYADRLGLLLIMQRANTLSYGHMVRLHKRFKLDKFFSDCESTGLPVEHKYDNIGFINNKPVLIDFGS